MATADVAVMGGGIMGLAVAWALCRRGARVRVVEARRIGYGPQRVDNVRLIADSVATVNFKLSVAATRLDQVTDLGRKLV